MLKGQIDKAIKEYQQVVALDPREIRFRQRLAELLVRDNRKQEAIAEYEDIGKHYAENSYFLKAIAVYKQIQRLDPANPAVAHTLASLNQRQGLTGNALAEYNQTVRLLEQQGSLAQAVTVVQEMLALDGDNSAIHLKHAELLHATAQHDASHLAFSALFKRLVQGGDEAAAERVSQRMKELFSGKEEHELELLALRVQKGDVDGALAGLREQLARDERNLKAWGLLCDVLRRKGDQAEVQGALERMAAIFPDDLSVLENTVRCDLECGMHDKAARLLEEHLDRFLSAGQGKELEALFLALPDALRAEPQVQEGLRRVYEALGDWEKLNSLRAPVLQMGGAAVSAPFSAAEYEPQPAWEEEIELDFDEPLVEGAAQVPPAEAPPQGAMELEWPEEPEPFAQEEAPTAQQSAPSRPAEEPADLPWGELELDLPAPPEEPRREEHPEEDEGPDFLGLDAEPFDLSLQETSVAEPEGEDLPLDLEPDGLELEFPAAEGGVGDFSGAPAVDEGEGALSWNDLFPGCLDAEGTVDREDAESHYDLGIAYMEMGRFDAALQEFAVAASNPRRRLDCLILQAMSHRSKGDDAAAEALLEKGLLVGGLDPRERMPLTYELAALHEEKGGVERAVSLYRTISALDPSFRDVAQKLSLLAGEEPLDIIDLEVEEVL